MLPVSDEFKDAIRANIRQIKARVVITWADPSVDSSSITVSANENAYISYRDQVCNSINLPTKKWAYLDSDCVTDGTFYCCPNPVESLTNEMGWWGSSISGVGGVFSTPYPTLTIEFSSRPVWGIFIAGEQIYNQYPVDFDVEIYKDITLLYTKVVTNNTEKLYSVSIAEENITDANKMKLVIKKWSKAGDFVKILEFYSSIYETYEGDDIVKLSLLEESEVQDGSLPIGNISCNEIDLELQNIWQNRFGSIIYDPYLLWNDNSPYRTLLKKNRRIDAWIGAKLADDSIEYVPIGSFWTGDWKSSNKSTVVSVTARDRMELLRNAQFSTSSVYANTDLYDLAEIVLNDAKINIPMHDLLWNIDDRLHDYEIGYAYFPKKNYMETLKDICVACLGTCYINRSDELIIL